jgi:membrane protein DedA with SNARE-associated domain
MNIEQFIIDTFYQYAYKPVQLYGFIICFMTASSFGMPIPEELILVTAGLIAFMGMHPDRYPPPIEGSDPVNVYTLAAVCFCAVLFSDILIYFLGRFFGDRLFKTKLFASKVGPEKIEKFNGWFQKYSYWVCGLFRFMPGIRFFGHMTCGAMRIPVLVFISIDALASLLSVPTQVLLVASYGDVIIAKMKEFKIAILILLLICGVIYLIRKKFKKNIEKTNQVSVE